MFFCSLLGPCFPQQVEVVFSILGSFQENPLRDGAARHHSYTPTTQNKAQRSFTEVFDSPCKTRGEPAPQCSNPKPWTAPTYANKRRLRGDRLPGRAMKDYQNLPEFGPAGSLPPLSLGSSAV